MALGDILRALKDKLKVPLGRLTVLSKGLDPYRLDTPANHELGRWFRDQLDASGLLHRPRPIHNRGAFYAVLARGDATLLCGQAFENTIDNWDLFERASKAARWLRYVGFDKIFDARNAEPIVRVHSAPDPYAYIRVNSRVELPDADELEPRVVLTGLKPMQPYRLVFFGEKTSLEEVLGPLATEFQADLFLPAGELSDTLVHTMAKAGAEDGREMVVFVFADADPSGYQMAVSIGHKLRALKDGFFPHLRFRVLAPALTVEQVRELGLPSTPLKPKELRASGWRQRYGCEQTEIDALSALRPGVLRQLVRDAVAPYFDPTLDVRAFEAENEWEDSAQEALEAQIDSEYRQQIRTEMEPLIAVLQEKVQALEIDASDIGLPDYPTIEPILPDDPGDSLITSDMPLGEHIQVLRARKSYAMADTDDDENGSD